MISLGRNTRWFNKFIDEVEFCKNNGFDFLQVWYDSKGFSLEKDPYPLDTIKSVGFPSIIHALLDINEIVDLAPQLLDILLYLEHNEIIIHPVCKSEEINKESIKKLTEKMSYMTEFFVPERITVYLENNSRLDPIFHSCSEIEYVFSKIPALEFLIDIAHIDSYDHLRHMVKIKMPKVLHISDRQLEKVHEHLPLGDGNIDFKYIFDDILKDFEGKAIFEIPESDKIILKSKRIFKSILNRRMQEPCGSGF
ncbi:TIM barrel protein [Pseudobacteroides cellulosolvens]|uniref:Xylose isomerase-like TIM barrel domain-containing protein n=1 Tax=Pseudobacteroides cellulosolvens ATCC 35603 = DSM 2933 TaxID=398512 RepID=A0A0L6JKS3_9FIRM|nr:TIM barrel protein [Pseudobacteroides cellulosolvens]KNY26389.1 hypothetical protein Bccel_1651 [Pseudobacteroides cellulosolvens ATCC 35603 = DSM 2933]